MRHSHASASITRFATHAPGQADLSSCKAPCGSRVIRATLGKHMGSKHCDSDTSTEQCTCILHQISYKDTCEGARVLRFKEFVCFLAPRHAWHHSSFLQERGHIPKAHCQRQHAYHPSCMRLTLVFCAPQTASSQALIFSSVQPVASELFWEDIAFCTNPATSNPRRHCNL